MAKFNLTRSAVHDLAEIWNYTYEEWSENKTNKYYYELLESCQTAADHINNGRKYDMVEIGLLGYKSNHHVIFFRRISENEIEIITILHERMDLKSKF